MGVYGFGVQGFGFIFLWGPARALFNSLGVAPGFWFALWGCLYITMGLDLKRQTLGIDLGI